MARKETNSGAKVVRHASLFLGAMLCIWSTATVMSGLASVNWQASELLRQYLIAAGLMQDFHTLSDFYTHIKGVEYIIAVAFLSGFPVFFSALNKTNATANAAN